MSDGSRKASRLSVELTIATPPGRVWEAITDPLEIARWHGWDEPGLGREIDQIFVSGARADAPSLVLETADGRFELADAGDGRTRLRVLREGEGGYADAIDQGWHTFVRQLGFYLERHLGGRRRTLYLVGLRRESSPPSVAELSERLGPEADELFRTDDQLGFAVDGWGEALLILTDRWMCVGKQVSALLSTYDLEPDRFAEVATELRDRFYEEFEPIVDAQPEA